MASKVVKVTLQPVSGPVQEVVVDVEHLPTDSYSRSVRRAARKALRQLTFLGGTWMELPWEFDLAAPVGRCRTRVTFVEEQVDAAFDVAPEPGGVSVVDVNPELERTAP